jgi:hypothetical protein
MPFTTQSTVSTTRATAAPAAFAALVRTLPLIDPQKSLSQQRSAPHQQRSAPRLTAHASLSFTVVHSWSLSKYSRVVLTLGEVFGHANSKPAKE